MDFLLSILSGVVTGVVLIGLQSFFDLMRERRSERRLRDSRDRKSIWEDRKSESRIYYGRWGSRRLVLVLVVSFLVGIGVYFFFSVIR